MQPATPRYPTRAAVRAALAAALSATAACESGEHFGACAAAGAEASRALATHGLCGPDRECRREPSLWYCGGELGRAVRVTVRRVTDPRAVADVEAGVRRAAAGLPPGWQVTLAFYREFRDGGPSGLGAPRPFRRVTFRSRKPAA